MSGTRFAIIGLYAAYLLQQAGIDDYILLEAQPRLGGRVQPFSSNGTGSQFDSGATWLWPDVQPEFFHLIQDLSLSIFSQYDAGDILLEKRINVPPIRVMGYSSTPTSMRIEGGMSALVDALYLQLDRSRALLNRRLTSAKAVRNDVILQALDQDGRLSTYSAETVLLALPPRLAASILFDPPLPHSTYKSWTDTATWMAPHAKYIAIYDAPFWREHGLSGEARSAVGPLAEIHDASSPDGDAALFGYFGMAASSRNALDPEVLKAQCLNQLIRIFGKSAAKPKAAFIKDWAADPWTASTMDQEATTLFKPAPFPSTDIAPWNKLIVGIGSEWSPYFPGYLAGAIDATHRTLSTLLQLEVE